MSTYTSNKKVLVYCRESRDDYGEKYERIETQRDILLKFCERQGLNNIVKIIMDDNMSGTSFERLNTVKEMIEKKEIDIFICKDASRLGRNLRMSLEFIEFAQEHEIEIIFESEKFNADMFPLLAWFNERRAKDDSDKIRHVLRHKLEEGLIIMPPYGYMKENGIMVPNPDTAPVVEKIFEMAKDGSTPSQISNYLNIMKIDSPSAHRKMCDPMWNRDKVRRILKNPVYTGTQISGKVQKVSYKSKRSKKVPEDQQIILEHHHEAIVDKETFNHIQMHMNTFKLSCRQPSYNPFSGLLKCGRCKKTIVLRTNKNKEPDKYICSKYNLEGNIKDDIRDNWGCNPHLIYYNDLKKLVNDYIRGFMEDENLRREIINSIKTKDNTSIIENNLKKLKEKEKKLSTTFDKMYEDKLKGILPEFIFVEKSQNIIEELENTKKNIEYYKSELNIQKKSNPVEEYKGYIEKMYYDGITSETMQKLFKEIVVFEKGEITETDKENYNLTDTSYYNLFNNGGIIFVQKENWNNIIHSSL